MTRGEIRKLSITKTIIVVVLFCVLKKESLEDERWLKSRKNKQEKELWNKRKEALNKRKKHMICFVSSESEKSLTFSVMKREDNEKRWKEALYYSWFLKAFRNEENEFDGMLDRKGITYYQDQIISSLGKQGERYDVKRVVNEENSEYIFALDLFKKTVGSKEKDIQVLWDAYKAGEKVQNYNDTSENVFQTGVLAETAHFYALEKESSSGESIQYAAGVFQQFDKFLTFKVLD